MRWLRNDLVVDVSRVRKEGEEMPAAFEACVRKGGRVRTKKLSGGRYMHICFLNGKSYAGEVKKRQSALAQAVKERK